MTVGVIYPDYLPDFMLGKQRAEKQGYVVEDPLQGSPYIEQRTEDIPVFWDFEITCKSRTQARNFVMFVKSVKGGKPFLKSILTEYGHVTHEVAFTVEPRVSTNLSEGVWKYSGQIYATKLLTPSALLFINRNQ